MNGPTGDIRGEVRFDRAHPKVTEWLLAGNTYAYYPTAELEEKSFVAQFLVSKQLDIILPLLPNISRLEQSDVQMLQFNLDGFAEAAVELDAEDLSILGKSAQMLRAASGGVQAHAFGVGFNGEIKRCTDVVGICRNKRSSPDGLSVIRGLRCECDAALD